MYASKKYQTTNEPIVTKKQEKISEIARQMGNQIKITRTVAPAQAIPFLSSQQGQGIQQAWTLALPSVH